MCNVLTLFKCCVGCLLLSVRLYNVVVLSVWHGATVVAPGKVLGPTEPHHKHTLPRFLGKNVIWDGRRVDHLTWPPPLGAWWRVCVCVCVNERELMSRVHYDMYIYCALV